MSTLTPLFLVMGLLIAIFRDKTIRNVLFGELVLPCAVLKDGTRVLSQRGVMKALGRTRRGERRSKRKASITGGAHQLPVFVSAANLESFISDTLSAALTNPFIIILN